MSRLSELEVFVQVVKEGSFTAAAERLGISKSYVSKRVRALEALLGGQLLIRNTRHVTLTAAGKSYFERCCEALQLIEEAEEELGLAEGEMRGKVRITAPHDLGRRFVPPALAPLFLEHPHLELELGLNDARVDLVEQGYDLAVRAGFELADSTLMVRRLCRFNMHLCASPEYLARRGRPAVPQDLTEHDCLTYTRTRGSNRWAMTGPDRREQEIIVSARVASDSGAAICQAAVHGLGIAMVPDFVLQRDVREGRLVVLLKDYQVASQGSVWAVWPPGRRSSSKVAACVSALAEGFARTDWAIPEGAG